MADYASQYELGEDIDGSFNGGSNTRPVKYTETVAMGNPLNITGNNQIEDNTNVELVDDVSDKTRYIAIHDGVADQVLSVLVKGRTKIQLGGTVAAGDDLEVTAAGLFILAAGTNPIVGHALQSGVNADLIQIYFDGGLA